MYPIKTPIGVYSFSQNFGEALLPVSEYRVHYLYKVSITWMLMIYLPHVKIELRPKFTFIPVKTRRGGGFASTSILLCLCPVRIIGWILYID